MKIYKNNIMGIHGCFIFNSGYHLFIIHFFILNMKMTFVAILQFGCNECFIKYCLYGVYILCTVLKWTRMCGFEVKESLNIDFGRNWGFHKNKYIKHPSSDPDALNNHKASKIIFIFTFSERCTVMLDLKLKCLT